VAFVAVEGGTCCTECEVDGLCSKGFRGDTTGFKPAGAEEISIGLAGAGSGEFADAMPVLSIDEIVESGTPGGVTSLPDPTELLMLLLQVIMESSGDIDKS
jgi:hypothetical protein